MASKNEFSISSSPIPKAPNQKTTKDSGSDTIDKLRSFWNFGHTFYVSEGLTLLAHSCKSCFIFYIRHLHVGKLLLLDLGDGGGAGLHLVPPGGHHLAGQGAEQRLKVCLVGGAGRGANPVISEGQLRDGGEGGGDPDHREERGVGGREHVEQDHAGEAHQQEDQPCGETRGFILSILKESDH